MKYFTASNRAGVTVNGVDLSRFNAKLSAKYQISGAEIAYNTMQGKNRTFFESLGSRYGMKEITLPIDIETDSRITTTLNVTQLNAAFNGAEYAGSNDIIARYRNNEPVIIDLGDGYLYRAVCTSCGAPAWINECACSVDYTFSGVRINSLQSTQIKSGNPYAICTGTYPRNDCRITIDITATNIANLTASGGIWLLTSINSQDISGTTYSIASTNWQAKTWFNSNTSAAQKIIYDGIGKSMTLNGTARGPDRMVWTDYPWLTPGANGPWCYYSATGEPNTWQIATNIVKNVVEWYPTYI